MLRNYEQKFSLCVSVKHLINIVRLDGHGRTSRS